MNDLIERRLDAYYYGFDSTGNDLVDKILGAVACAGKSVHHTDGWGEEMQAYDDHIGATPAEWIQNAANTAADALKSTQWNTDMDAAPRDAAPILVKDAKIGRNGCPEISCVKWREAESGFYTYKQGPTMDSSVWLDRPTYTHWMLAPE